MFTGLIETTGTVVSVAPSAGGTRITVEAPESLVTRLRTGDSVAVSGTCLTALEIAATHFSADLAQETLERTTLGRLRAGATVNLELPTPVDLRSAATSCRAMSTAPEACSRSMPCILANCTQVTGGSAL